MKWFQWKTWNDQLALVVVILIFVLWGIYPWIKNYYGYGFPESVIGATVSIMTMIVQFYFRRKEPNGEGGGTK